MKPESPIRETAFPPMSGAAAREAAARFGALTEISDAELAAALLAPQGETGGLYVARVWARLGALLPPRAALGIALLAAEAFAVRLETPDDVRAFRHAGNGLPFGDPFWERATADFFDARAVFAPPAGPRP